MNKTIFVLALVALSIFAFSVSATPSVDYCIDYDGGVDIWTGAYANSNKGVLVDDCDGQSDNLKEATCVNDKTHPENVKCTDFGAVCVSVGDESEPDYCGCPEGTSFSEEFDMCISDNADSVPEFGTIGAGLVLAGAGAYFSRKRK